MPLPYNPGRPPYHDNFSPTKNFNKVLFRPGVPVMNEELNELQSILAYNAQKVHDGIFTDGDIISGCQILVQETGMEATLEVIISPGQVYYRGLSRELAEFRTEISNVGVYKFGVKVNQDVITEFDDPGLLDPAQGFMNYRNSGAHRLHEVAVIVVNDPDAATIYTVEDGQIIEDDAGSDDLMSRFTSILARRTYDESGNYKVWGYILSEKLVTPANPDFLFATMSAGKAYVMGYEILRQNASTLNIPRAKGTRTVSAEPKPFVIGTSQYMLNNKPVSEITDLVCLVSITMQMTRGSVANGTDPIPPFYRPAVDIQSITQPATGKTYIKGQDFLLTADAVNWNLPGQEPAAGESYTMEFTYNRTMIYGLDYDLYTDGSEYYMRLLKDYSTPTEDENGNTVNGIVNNSTMLIDYGFYLYYIATVTLNSRGQFAVVQGQSDTLDAVQPPNIVDKGLLIMGDILVSPMNDTLTIKNTNNLRLSMADLQRLANRIFDLEYNQAVSDLDNEAMVGEEPTRLKGIYTDGFIGFTKCDVHFNQSGVMFNSAIDPENEELTLSAKSQANQLILEDRTDLQPISSYTKYRRVLTAHASEFAVLNQPLATRVTLINPYQVFPEKPSMTIDPEVDTWIETNTILIDGGTTISDSIIRTSGSYNTSWVQSETSETSFITRILESAIMYMRPTTINVVGYKFRGHSTGIRLNFNDEDITNFTAAPEYTGTEPGDLKADVNGEVRCSFVVPPSVMCGSVAVMLYDKNDTNYYIFRTFTAEGMLQTTETTSYTTVFRTIIEQVYTPPPYYDVYSDTPYRDVYSDTGPYSDRYRESYPDRYSDNYSDEWADYYTDRLGGDNYYRDRYDDQGGSGGYDNSHYEDSSGNGPWWCSTSDPLAQTFRPSKDTIVSSIGLYFGVVDTLEPVTIQVKSVNQGYPSYGILAEKILKPSDIIASPNGEDETIVTFDDPVYLLAGVEYCFVIMTQSAIASVYTAKVGENDIISGEQVVSNPYLDGVMFSSSNATAWTPHQDEDLKFKIYGNAYYRKGYAYFQELTGVRYDRLWLVANIDVPANTKLSFEFSRDGGYTWLPIFAGKMLELNFTITRFLLRARIQTSREISPAIALDSIQLIGYLNNTDCNYISRNVVLDSNYTTVKQVVDVLLPSATGMNFNMYFATDTQGLVWQSPTMTDSKVLDANGYVRYTFEATLPEPGVTAYRARIHMTTNDSTLRHKFKNLMSILK